MFFPFPFLSTTSFTFYQHTTRTLLLMLWIRRTAFRRRFQVRPHHLCPRWSLEVIPARRTSAFNSLPPLYALWNPISNSVAGCRVSPSSVSTEGCCVLVDTNADPFLAPSAERRPSPSRGFSPSTSERPATVLSLTLPASALSSVGTVQDVSNAAAETKPDRFSPDRFGRLCSTSSGSLPYTRPSFTVVSLPSRLYLHAGLCFPPAAALTPIDPRFSTKSRPRDLARGCPPRIGCPRDRAEGGGVEAGA